MQLTKSVITLVLLMLIGCATTYVEPTGPDTATITFSNTSASDIGVQAFSVAENCSGGKVTFNKPRLFPREELNVRVKADQAFSFFFQFSLTTGNGAKYCLIPVTFTPKQDRRYIARFSASDDKLLRERSIPNTGRRGEGADI